MSEKEKILSEASGNHEIINENTVIIEETTGGRIISGNKDGTLIGYIVHKAILIYQNI